MAKSSDVFVKASHVSMDMIKQLNWGSFIINNLIPVTLGNIVGGTFFVGMIYWLIYSDKRHKIESRKETECEMSA